MRLRHAIVGIFLACLSVLWASAQAAEVMGVVFNDENANGQREASERGIRDVCVSNGVDVVATDKTGSYRLPVTDDTIVFVIKPSGWMTPVGPNDMIPRFYYIHRPNGSPSMKYAGVAPTGPLPVSVDFPLRRQSEPKKFRIVCLGDPQVRNVEEVGFLTHDVLDGLIGVEAAFGVTLGDNVFNDLTVFEAFIPALSLVRIPWYCTPGNHDHNHDAVSPDDADDTFERFLGPSYYSFDYASVHFIVLNNIRQESGREDYHGGLGSKQMAFVQNDLRHVSLKKLVVLLMHIPIAELDERYELYGLLKPFQHTFSLSAHTHTQQHMFIDVPNGWAQATPHHHMIHGTACGSWWGGVFDEEGIPVTPMADGVPNGYSFISFDGPKYSVDFRPARMPADYQMNIWLPDRIALAEVRDTEAVVNVFAGSSRSRVEMKIDNGPWAPMSSFRGKAPYYVELHNRQTALVEKLAKAQGKEIDKEFLRQTREDLKSILRGLPEPDDTDHLWRAGLPKDLAEGSHILYVRTTDMFGQRYSAERGFTVTRE